MIWAMGLDHSLGSLAWFAIFLAALNGESSSISEVHVCTIVVASLCTLKCWFPRCVRCNTTAGWCNSRYYQSSLWITCSFLWFLPSDILYSCVQHISHQYCQQQVWKLLTTIGGARVPVCEASQNTCGDKGALKTVCLQWSPLAGDCTCPYGL